MSQNRAPRRYPRSVLGAAALVALTVSAVGCSDDQPSATTAPATTATTAPSTTAGPSTTAAGATTTVDGSTDSRLLTVADIGEGWQPGEPANEMDLAMNTKVCEGVELDSELAARLSGAVGVQFTPTDDSPKNLMTQIISGEPAQLASDLDAYETALRSCPVDPAGAEGTFLSVEAMTVGALGDQASGTRVKAQEPGNGAVWFIRLLFVRVGANAVSIGLVEILDLPTDTPKFSDADVVGWAEKAAAKLAA